MFLINNNIIESSIFGCAAVKNPLPPLTGEELVTLRGTHNGASAAIGLTEKLLEKHILMVGSTGCGKTRTFLKIVNQLQQRMTADDVMIIFDTKGDYDKKIRVKGEKLILGNSNTYRNRPESVRWNLFREILIDDPCDAPDDAHVVTNTQEICRSLFVEREKRTNNPFFPNAARDLLAAIITSVIRTGYQQDRSFRIQQFNNKALAELLNTRTQEELDYILSFDADLTAVRSYLSGSGDQAAGVVSEMNSVAREVLTGVFADVGDFSVRNFVREKGCKTLFIEYDLSLGASLTPIYRLLIDLALKEALGRNEEQEKQKAPGNKQTQNEEEKAGNVYLICDEFRLLPFLQHIDDGVNFGRSLGVKVIAGLQSIEQLFEVYQESRGRNIAAGFSTIFAFHSTDPSTLHYITKAFGQYEVREEYRLPDNRMDYSRRRGDVISDWDLIHLDVGEAFICPAFGKPFTFKFDR